MQADRDRVALGVRLELRQRVAGARPRPVGIDDQAQAMSVERDCGGDPEQLQFANAGRRRHAGGQALAMAEGVVEAGDGCAFPGADIEGALVIDRELGIDELVRRDQRQIGRAGHRGRGRQHRPHRISGQVIRQQQIALKIAGIERTRLCQLIRVFAQQRRGRTLDFDLAEEAFDHLKPDHAAPDMLGRHNGL